jgi:hypothetical protein
MCDSSIRNKKFCSANFMFLRASNIHIRHMRVAVDYSMFEGKIKLYKI